MWKIFKTIVKKLVFSFFALYGISLIMGLLNIHVPINIFSVSVSAVLGFPGIISILLVYVFLL